MKILIVDDEPLARERLRDLITETGEDHTIFEAHNGLAAIEQVDKERPDLVLLDIRMPVMDGLEAAYHLTALDNPPALIFTTAYQDHAIEAFDANAVDYLLKPIRGERLLQALHRASVINRARITEIRESDTGSARARTHLSSSSHGRIELIPVNDIRFLKADQKYVVVGCPQREYLIDEPLKSLEQEFTDRFLRIHRSTLVASAHIEAMEKDKDGVFHIRMQDVQERLAVSRRHLPDVRLAFKQRD